MSFVNVLQALTNSTEACRRQFSKVFSSSAKRLVQLFLLPLLVLAAVVFSAPASYATVTGTNVTLDVPDIGYTNGPHAVGPGAEINGVPMIDVDPDASTITIAVDPSFAWGMDSFDLIFSGGTLTQFTSVSRTGGTAPNASLYSATATSKTITINVPSGQLGEGTIVFSFSTPAPAITAQPSNSAVATGANTTFSVTASDAAGYQWQVSTDGGSSFNDIGNSAPYSGATTPTLSITGATAGMNGYRYRAVATGSTSPAATSNAAMLTVNSPPSITAQPSSSTIVAGANTTFSVIASNATSYQWQVNTGSGFATISNGAPYSGADTATLSITGATAGMNGYQYRAVVSGSTSPAATSTAATLTVQKATPTVTLTSSNANPAFGTSITFTATLAGGASPGGTVTFKDGATALGTETISGTTATFTSSTLTVGSHSITAEYDGDTNNATATSAAVSVAVGKVAPAMLVSASDINPAFGASVTLTAELSGAVLPSGTVMFKDGATTLGTVAISGTTATWPAAGFSDTRLS